MSGVPRARRSSRVQRMEQAFRVRLPDRLRAFFDSGEAKRFAGMTPRGLTCCALEFGSESLKWKHNLAKDYIGSVDDVVRRARSPTNPVRITARTHFPFGAPAGDELFFFSVDLTHPSLPVTMHIAGQAKLHSPTFEEFCAGLRNWQVSLPRRASASRRAAAPYGVTLPQSLQEFFDSGKWRQYDGKRIDIADLSRPIRILFFAKELPASFAIAEARAGATPRAHFPIARYYSRGHFMAVDLEDPRLSVRRYEDGEFYPHAASFAEFLKTIRAGTNRPARRRSKANRA